MRKRIVAVVVACAVAGCMGLFGCSSSKSGSSGSSGEAKETQQAQQAEPAKEEKAASSKYAVTIDGCSVAADYQGRSAVVVTYTFTNNADKATSFFVAISAKCFQNGVQLDSGVVSDIDSQGALNEIKPGATTTVQKAYLLDDQTDVTVECTELISLSDAVLAEATFAVA